MLAAIVTHAALEVTEIPRPEKDGTRIEKHRGKVRADLKQQQASAWASRVVGSGDGKRG
jgi:hypothetical protein